MRECGKCRLCCKVMAVPELKKPRGEWCAFAIGPTLGCSIYSDRPKSCQDFDCAWLQMDGVLPDDLRPDKVHAVFTSLKEGDGMAIILDPGYPMAHKAPKLAKLIDGFVSRGGTIIVACGNRRTLIKQGSSEAVFEKT